MEDPFLETWQAFPPRNISSRVVFKQVESEEEDRESSSAASVFPPYAHALPFRGWEGVWDLEKTRLEFFFKAAAFENLLPKKFGDEWIDDFKTFFSFFFSLTRGGIFDISGNGLEFIGIYKCNGDCCTRIEFSKVILRVIKFQTRKVELM